MVRVLVFDDDEAVGQLVVMVATLSGLEATAVTSSEAFVASLHSDPPHLVVLDLQLGATDGVEQMRLLAEQQYTGSLVLMSGCDARVLETVRALGQSLGLKLVSVLEKPMQVANLDKVFEKLVSASRSLSSARLLEAIANDELILDFQPVVTRKPKALRKLEALIRWEHPIMGRIPPAEFLPLAEGDQATIDALTDWVVGATIDAYEVLVGLGMRVPLSVNLSRRNLHDLTLPDRLEQRLRAGGMPPGHLYLEVTESASFEDAARSMDILSRIRLKGMQLSLDDFGIGYASLKMLRQMPFSEIKIDRSFIGDATTSRDSRAIVKAIIDLAANMEMGCVAEGVETEATAAMLEQLGAHDMQGFLIARPMPIEVVPAWLAIWQSGSDTLREPRPAPIRQLIAPYGRAIHSAALSPPWPSDRPATGNDPSVHLSPRQIDVMRLLSEGCSAKEIARRLNLGIGTVKVHLSLAYSALGARNRVEAVLKAGLHGQSAWRERTTITGPVDEARRGAVVQASAS